MTSLDNRKYRLPTNVKPLHYDLIILTDLKSQQFEGFVKVSLEVKEQTSEIVLNAEDLGLGQATITYNGHGEEVLVSHTLDSSAKRATFATPEPLPTSTKVHLGIPFKGNLADSMTGYYKSLSATGQLYSLTQFEPTDARRAFPCWDEPALKATYKITMISRADTVNLSNMAVASEEMYDPLKQDTVHAEIHKNFPRLKATGDRWKITQFQSTPLMSSYLVAYANGPFNYLETSIVSSMTGKTIPLRVYATPDLIHQAQFALDVKAKVLPLYEQIFDVGYPLPKLDTLVATDFDAGAMENWGLITGRTNVFLLDPNKQDITAKKFVVTVQSHEVAHQWFGNITTMAWWDYLYLNEGFATLMGEVIIPNRVFPEFRPNSEFINEHLSVALALDAKLSSHPIEVECPDADRIGQIFDSLSYSKAASVLRMLANYVGEERFLKGVSLYLKNHLYANSITDDLWKGISKATGIDISHLMDHWITKTGYPVLTVTESDDAIHVRQNRFLETGLPKPEDDTTLWQIPLSILSVDPQTGEALINNTIVLKDRDQTIPLDTSRAFKLNAGTAGVYRVFYTPERLINIAHEAARKDSCFSVDDRMGLVDDAMALSKAGLAKISSALSLVQILRNEQEYLVWAGIASNLSALCSVWWEHPRIIESLKVFRRSLFVPLVEKLRYDFAAGESPDIVELRRCAIQEAASAEDEKVVAELRSRFDHFLKTGDDSRIPADIQRTIYSTAVKFGGVTEYDAILKIHQNPKTPSAGVAARYALASTTDHKAMNLTFQTIMTGCRDQDVIYFFRGLAQNTTARRPTVEFFKREYDILHRRYEKNFTMKDLVKYTFTPLSTQKDYDDTQAFFKDKDSSRYYMALAQSLDSIQAQAQYIERATDDLSQWLEQWRKEQL